eukprot:TRINITY_DN119_c0_g1_i1.p1 TRINITY_DN119_c0_g1~~TRINITY_DN119_c0_g1_i1.p1  ORF type:complete len:142 (-),score=55.81 TRINITY_DN119_c0_g1_i1:406-831(-)
MKLQQDLFVMSTHTVFRHLEEERIWNVDAQVRDMFCAQNMYPIALKNDIPWRQWQYWIRDQITTYLRENGGVLPNPNFVPPSQKQAIVTVPPYIPPQYPQCPSMVNTAPYVQPPTAQIQIYPSSVNPNDGNIAEEEKCSLM